MQFIVAKSMVLFLFVTLLFSPYTCFCQNILPLLRISVENAPTHIQTMAVRRFADDLRTQLAGSINVEFFDSAQLYRDRDVFTALREGKVEMAVPGTWQISRFEPNISIFLLPEFYGRNAQATYTVLNSDVGTKLKEGIEDALHVVTIGTWLDLGHAHIFSVDTKITSRHDIQGLRIRVAGGEANELRLQALGAQTLTIPWPDFPLWLGKHEVDGVLTTYETIRSAKLWEKGIRFVYEDSEYFPQYIPIMNKRFWSKLSKKQQDIIISCWEKAAAWEHEAAKQAQDEARDTLVQHGAIIVTPSEQELSSTRTFLFDSQESIINTLGLNKELVEQTKSLLRH